MTASPAPTTCADLTGPAAWLCEHVGELAATPPPTPRPVEGEAPELVPTLDPLVAAVVGASAGQPVVSVTAVAL